VAVSFLGDLYILGGCVVYSENLDCNTLSPEAWCSRDDGVSWAKVFVNNCPFSRSLFVSEWQSLIHGNALADGSDIFRRRLLVRRRPSGCGGST
jgi:hypothetical protein